MADKPKGEGSRPVRLGKKDETSERKTMHQERYDFIKTLSASISSNEQDAMRSDLSRVVFKNDKAKSAKDPKEINITLGELFERFFWKRSQENANNPVTFNSADTDGFRKFYWNFFKTHVEVLKPNPFIKGEEASPLTEQVVGQPTTMDDVAEQQGKQPKMPSAPMNPRQTKGAKVFKFSVDDRRHKDK